MLIQMKIIFTDVFQCGLSKKKKKKKSIMKHAEVVGGKSNNLVLCIHFRHVSQIANSNCKLCLVPVCLSVRPSICPSARNSDYRQI